MENLIDLKANIFYKKEDSGKYKKYFELIFLTARPSYSMSNRSTISSEITLSENRIVVSEENLSTTIDSLKAILETEEKDLK